MTLEGVDQGERNPLLPKVVELNEDEYGEFPIIRKTLEGGYQVLELPEKFRELFKNGAHIVIVRSRKLAELLPDLGGRPSGTGSLPFHRDLDKNNAPMQILVLWQATKNERGASTIVMLPEVGAELLSVSETFFKERKKDLKKEATYDMRFNITEDAFNHCFDTESGYEDAVRTMAGESADEATETTIRLSLLGYLIRGSSANELMKLQMKTAQGRFVKIPWKEPGVAFIYNPTTLHGREVEYKENVTDESASVDTVKRLYCV